MSFYTVDGPVQNHAQGDLGYGAGPGQSTEMFPMAHPSGQSANLNRQPTSASSYNNGPSLRSGDNVIFPVPLAAPAMPPPTSASSCASAQSNRGQLDSPFPSAVGVAK
jgi:hypothetical protein